MLDDSTEDPMTRSRIGIGALTALLALLPALPGVAPALAADETGGAHAAMYAAVQQSVDHVHVGDLGEKALVLEQALKCNCGCGLDVHSCQFQMQCDTSPSWSERIRTQLAQGMDPEVIQAGFVADFGPTVLMAPPAQGFNLVGYLLPGMAILMAGVLVGLLARGNGQRNDERLATVGEVSDEDARRLREELALMEEAESPDW